jgi:hypothetical protein
MMTCSCVSPSGQAIIEIDHHEGTGLAVNESSEMMEMIDPAGGGARLMRYVSIVEGKTQMSDSADEDDEGHYWRRYGKHSIFLPPAVRV